MLQQKRIVEEAIWSNPQIELFLQEDEGPGLAVSIFDLVKTFQDVLERLKNRPIYEIGKEDVSVPDMVRYLRDQFEKLKKDKTLSATRLFEQQQSRRAMICLFLAILEMVKRQAIELVQGETFGDIALRRHESYDQAVLPEDLTAVEQDYQ
jgi:segregation and condensation protein A